MATMMNQLDRNMMRAAISGSGTEALAGATAVVLAILGLASIKPEFMVAVATIALGGALIFDGAAIASEYSRILAHSGTGTIRNAELGSGVGTQIGGGAAAAILGVLALLSLDPATLLASATVVLGVTLIFGSGIAARLNALKIETSGENETAMRVAREALKTATATEVVVGVGATVLGILALVGLASLTLTLVAVLAMGGAVLLTGGTIVGKMIGAFIS